MFKFWLLLTPRSLLIQAATAALSAAVNPDGFATPAVVLFVLILNYWNLLGYRFG